MGIDKQPDSIESNKHFRENLEHMRLIEISRRDVRQRLALIANERGVSVEMLTLIHTIASHLKTNPGITQQEIEVNYPVSGLGTFIRDMLEDELLTSEEHEGKVYYQLAESAKSLLK